MRSWTVLTAVFVAVLAASPVQAVTLDYYTSFHVFGDSLSDRGNVYRATFHQEPKSPPYYKGRFSNGPVWAERVEAEFRALGLPTGNHAWGGAKAYRNAGLNPDIGLQASRYRLIDEDRRGDRPLAALWAGANDFKEVVGDPNPEVRSRARRAARAVGDAASSLTRAGVHDFLLFNLPDLGRVPKYASRDDPADALSATVYTLAFNRQLRSEIAGLREDGATVRRVNAYGLFNALLADPRRFGVRNTTTPCLQGDDVCSDRQARRRAFFDEIHPNFVVHERIAEAALATIVATEAPMAVAMAASLATIAATDAPVAVAMAVAAPAPVPLPAPGALIAAGLLWLGLLGRRRRARPLPAH